MSRISDSANAVVDPVLEFIEPFQDATVETVHVATKLVEPYSRALSSLLPASLPTLADVVDAELGVVERVTTHQWAYVKRLVNATRPALGYRVRAASTEHRAQPKAA
jgi:hypothetical protein